jgi:hypothetical protein
MIRPQISTSQCINSFDHRQYPQNLVYEAEVLVCARQFVYMGLE